MKCNVIPRLNNGSLPAGCKRFMMPAHRGMTSMPYFVLIKAFVIIYRANQLPRKRPQEGTFLKNNGKVISRNQPVLKKEAILINTPNPKGGLL